MNYLKEGIQNTFLQKVHFQKQLFEWSLVSKALNDINFEFAEVPPLVALVYWFKVNIRNTRKRCEISFKLTINTPFSSVSIVDSEQVNVTWFCLVSACLLLQLFFSFSCFFNPFRATDFFYTPGLHQKTSGFLMFSGGIKRDQWHEMG